MRNALIKKPKKIWNSKQYYEARRTLSYSLGLKRRHKKQRVYVIVSRQELIDSAYSTLICAPVYTNFEGLSTQVPVGIDEGLKHPSAIRCDELISILKSRLTDYVGTLSHEKLRIGAGIIHSVGRNASLG